MLLARMNKEYVDEDELAKKIVFDRTLRFVNNLYGDEPEVSLQQDQLTPTMQYSYDTLFEDFKGAINQVLESEDPEKSYLVIATYNKLSSYLKNVMNMNNLSQDDQAKIDKQFDSIKALLNKLKEFLRVHSYGIDSAEVIGIIDKINRSTSSRKMKHDLVSVSSNEIPEDKVRVVLEAAQNDILKLNEWHNTGVVDFTNDEVKRLEKLTDVIEQGGVDGILAQTPTKKEIERFLRKTEKLMAIKRVVVSGQRARNQARSVVVVGRTKDDDDDSKNDNDESDQKTPPRSKKKTKKKQKKQKKRGDNDDEEESKYDQFDPVSRTSYYPSDYKIEEDTGRQYSVEDAGANKLKFQRQPLPLGPLIKVPPVRRASHPKGWDAPPTPVSSTKPGRAQRLLNKISPFGKKK